MAGRSQRLMSHLAGALCAVLVLVWRLTCRTRIIDDPRPKLRSSNTPYVYALLHAHQIAAVMLNDEAQLAAMVSRSTDGDLLVPSLRLRGVVPVRGSSRKGSVDKGGSMALEELERWVQRGVPALLAVDGPRGPRGRVHRGVLSLANNCQAVILPVVARASRFWVLHKTWDHMEVPKPFSRLELVFCEPIWLNSRFDLEEEKANLGRILQEKEREQEA